MYAIVKVSGKQYRVEKGDSLVVDRIDADEGAKLALEPLLYRSDKTVFEGAELGRVKVEAVVSGHERGRKIRVQKFKPKRGYKRVRGHRSELTRLEIKEIKLGAARSGGTKASAELADAKQSGGAAPAKESGKPAAKAASTRSGAAKSGAAKSGATRSGATRSGASKPAAKPKATARKKDDDGS